MSIGLLRVLVQHKLVPQDKLEKYQSAISADKNILPMIFDDGVISPENLVSLLSSVFNYPILDLNYYPRSGIVRDIMDEQHMQKLRCIPIFKRGRRVFMAVSDPTQLQNIQKALFSSGLNVDLVLVRNDQLERLLEWFGQSSTSILKEIDTDSPESQQKTLIVDGDEEEDGPVARFIQKILSDALNAGASDIHFEFYETMARIRFRVDGQLPKNAKAIDFRVNTLPCLFGEKVVMRILNSDAATLNIDQLGFEDFQKELIMEAIHRPYGMVLVTGPTGSGKTVSLYTCLNILNTDDVNISTAEDPAEINLPGINQVNVNDKQGLTFEAALKAFLRQDPDIIMVGEIRDLGTADIAIKAAQTGHMVFSTLHTNNAPATLSRMLNMGVAPFNIASSVNLIMAQRLARRLCPACKTPVERPPEPALLNAGFTKEDLEGDWQMYRPVGCDVCKGKGYKGRAGLYEVMPITEKMKAVIMNNGTEVDIANIAYEEGLVDLRRSGILKVMQGITSLEEVMATTNE